MRQVRSVFSMSGDFCCHSVKLRRSATGRTTAYHVGIRHRHLFLFTASTNKHPILRAEVRLRCGEMTRNWQRRDVMLSLITLILAAIARHCMAMLVGHWSVEIKQEIWANAHETRDSISL